VQRLRRIETPEVARVVRDDDKIAVAGVTHDVPVFPPGLADMRDVLGVMACLPGDRDQVEGYLTAYLNGAELGGDAKGPLFRTIGRGTGKLTRTVLPQANAYAMIRRRAAGAGIATKLGNHSFRATGIRAYLKNGCTLEKAAAMANHASTRTTQLYDRRRDELSLDEVERIMI
jgi:hypothetical protein